MYIAINVSHPDSKGVHYHYQNFSPLANGTDLNREKYAILQTHWR